MVNVIANVFGLVHESIFFFVEKVICFTNL